MPIANDQELQEAAARAGALLQEIQDYCALQNQRWNAVPAARVRFPRGFLRTAEEQRSRLPFVTDRALKDNLAYTLMLSDTILWLRLRTDITATAGEMLVKLTVFLVGTLCESITKNFLHGRCGRNFKGRNEFLVAEGTISQALADDLDWVWDTRNNMHLFQLEEREYDNQYNDACYERCVGTFRNLIGALRAVA
jgi:hypothetical protein